LTPKLCSGTRVLVIGVYFSNLGNAGLRTSGQVHTHPRYMYRIMACAKGFVSVISKLRDAAVARPGLVQLGKFLIVGASSFVIDAGSFNILFYKLHLPLLFAKTITFMF